MSETSEILSRPISRVRTACSELFLLTLRRQMLSRQTLVCLALTTVCVLIVVAWGRQSAPTAKKLAQQVLMPTYIAFLLPIFAISFGASGVGGEREDRTLVYLLMTSIPRPLVYLVKSAATLLLVAAWAAGSLALLTYVAGSLGDELLPIFLPAAVLGGIVYAALFQLLGAAFRHGTIISLAYWFFLEVLFGAMPGVIKRITVAYYAKCLIYDAGESLKLAPLGRVARETFLPISGDAATTALGVAAVVLVTLGAVIFSVREYPELG